MTDNATDLPRSMKLPAAWRTRANGIWRTAGDISDLRGRLEQQGRDFVEIMRKDLGAEGLDPGAKREMTEALKSVVEHIQDALTLLKFADDCTGMAFAAIDAPFELGRK